MTRVFDGEILLKEEVMEGSVAARGRFARRVPNASGVKNRSSELGGRIGRHPKDPEAASTVLVLSAMGEALAEGSQHDGTTAGSGLERGER